MWNVFFKEILEILRDRRALVFMLLMPAVIIPTLILGYAWLAGTMEQDVKSQTLNYAIVSTKPAPILSGLLAESKNLKQASALSRDEATALIKDNKLDFAIVLPEDGEAGILSGKEKKIALYYNTAIVFDEVGKRIKPILEEKYTGLLRTEMLRASSLEQVHASSINAPLDLVVTSTASIRERQGEKLGAALPYILLMLGLTASAAVAIDMGAGEKERGTLESLLLLPISRTSIVFAKFLVILSVGAISGTIGVLSLALCVTLLLQSSGLDIGDNITHYIDLADFLWIAILMLPAYGIMAALQLSVSMFAKSHKEGATYVNQLIIFMLTPLLISMLPGMKLKGVWSFVPITNIALAVKDTIKGTAENADRLIVLGAASAVAAALLTFCTFWCKREETLFR